MIRCERDHDFLFFRTNKSLQHDTVIPVWTFRTGLIREQRSQDELDRIGISTVCTKQDSGKWEIHYDITFIVRE